MSIFSQKCFRDIAAFASQLLDPLHIAQRALRLQRRDGDREGDELADFAPSKSAFWPAALSAKYPLIISGLSRPTSFTPAASCLR
jgi:hypothetical protein